MPKTTAKQFKLFKTECRKWIDKLNLNDWEVHFQHIRLDNSVANCNAHYAGKLSTISFALWQNKNDIKDIKENAKHEALELLQMELGILAQKRTWNEDEYQRANHAVIFRLQKVLKG